MSNYVPKGSWIMFEIPSIYSWSANPGFATEEYDSNNPKVLGRF